MVLLIDNTVVSKRWFTENMKDDHMSYIIEEIKHWIVFQVRRFVSRMPWCEKEFKSLQKNLEMFHLKRGFQQNTFLWILVWCTSAFHHEISDGRWNSDKEEKQSGCYLLCISPGI